MTIRTRKAPISDRASDLQADDLSGISLEESAQARQARDANTITSWRLLTLSFLTANGLLLLVTIILQVIAASKPIAPFITRGNGEIESLEYMAGDKRPPELIVDFVRKTTIGIFSWRNTLPEEGNPPDPGVAVGSGKISTTSYRYSFALSTEFAKAFRVKLAEIAAQIRGGSGTETVYIPANISLPKQVAAGVWELEVVGNLYVGNKLEAGSSIPINRRVTVRAVPPMTLSEVAALYKKPGLFNSVARVRAAGLEITNMVPLK